MSEKIVFEHPVDERVRIYLRLENLYNRFERALLSDNVDLHYLALSVLFEIMKCAEPASIKLNILQDIEKQKSCLDDENLIEKLNDCAQRLQNYRHKFGQYLRENEWLMSVKQQMGIVGGVNPVEAPSYYYRDHLTAEERREQMREWSESMMPTGDAVRLLLHILRNNHIEHECVAQKGSFAHSGLNGQTMNLLQIETDFSYAVMPETSVNKYMMHIRFVGVDFHHVRAPQTEIDIPFMLRICSFRTV